MLSPFSNPFLVSLSGRVARERIYFARGAIRNPEGVSSMPVKNGIQSSQVYWLIAYIFYLDVFVVGLFTRFWLIVLFG